jgi:hypothetical protein
MIKQWYNRYDGGHLIHSRVGSLISILWEDGSLGNVVRCETGLLTSALLSEYFPTNTDTEISAQYGL